MQNKSHTLLCNHTQTNRLLCTRHLCIFVCCWSKLCHHNRKGDDDICISCFPVCCFVSFVYVCCYVTPRRDVKIYRTRWKHLTYTHFSFLSSSVGFFSFFTSLLSFFIPSISHFLSLQGATESTTGSQPFSSGNLPIFDSFEVMS